MAWSEGGRNALPLLARERAEGGTIEGELLTRRHRVVAQTPAEPRCRLRACHTRWLHARSLATAQREEELAHSKEELGLRGGHVAAE